MAIFKQIFEALEASLQNTSLQNQLDNYSYCDSKSKIMFNALDAVYEDS